MFIGLHRYALAKKALKNMGCIRILSHSLCPCVCGLFTKDSPLLNHLRIKMIHFKRAFTNCCKLQCYTSFDMQSSHVCSVKLFANFLCLKKFLYFFFCPLINVTSIYREKINHFMDNFPISFFLQLQVLSDHEFGNGVISSIFIYKYSLWVYYFL